MKPIKVLVNTVMYSYFLILAGCYSSTVSVAQDLNGKIMINVVLDRTSFKEGESIWAEVTIRNISGLDLYIPDPDQSDLLQVAVIDAKGRVLQSGIIIDRVVRPGELPYDTVSLPANGLIEETTSLASVLNDEGRTWMPPGNRLIPGDYKLFTALLYTSVKSDTFGFRIIEATPEERELANKINALLSPYTEQAIVDAKVLISRYPNSIYLSDIYDILLINLRLSKDITNRSDVMMRTALDLIEKFPASGYASDAVYDYLRGYLNKKGISGKLPDETRMIEDHLKELKSKYKGVRISRCVDKVIKLVRKNGVLR